MADDNWEATWRESVRSGRLPALVPHDEAWWEEWAARTNAAPTWTDEQPISTKQEF